MSRQTGNSPCDVEVSRRNDWTDACRSRGTYTYDGVAAKLRLTVDGGNALPGFRSAELAARVVGDQLSLDGPALAGELSGPSSPGCRSVFTRLGALR